MLKMKGCLTKWTSFSRIGIASWMNVSSRFCEAGLKALTCFIPNPSKSIITTTPLICDDFSSCATMWTEKRAISIRYVLLHSFFQFQCTHSDRKDGKVDLHWLRRGSIACRCWRSALADRGGPCSSARWRSCLWWKRPSRHPAWDLWSASRDPFGTRRFVLAAKIKEISVIGAFLSAVLIGNAVNDNSLSSLCAIF